MPRRALHPLWTPSAQPDEPRRVRQSRPVRHPKSEATSRLAAQRGTRVATTVTVLKVTMLAVLAVATVLATLAGAVDAVEWGCRTLGDVPATVAAGFLAGAAITHGIDRGLALRGSPADLASSGERDRS
jgi:hypothetical protein